MIAELATWLVDFVHSLGYLGLFIATFLESTFVPIPSAATMIPAGYLAHQGQWNIWMVWFIAITGTISGSLANYLAAYYMGRPLLARYGKFMLFGPKRQQQLDEYFARHGEISIFTARLLPGVRHVISFPAGLARMNIPKFCLLTGLGGGLWMSTLMLVGYSIGSMGVVMNEANMAEFYKELAGIYMPYMPYILGGSVAVVASIVGLYVWYYRNKVEKSHGLV
jgi:membrane protein DedA with SNARE-associated domain